jgi:hypothetical protein
MEFGVWSKGLTTLAVDCLVLGVFEEAELGGEARSVDTACGGRLKKILSRDSAAASSFSARAGARRGGPRRPRWPARASPAAQWRSIAPS